MATIRYSVGRNGVNHSDDVKIIQQLLQKNGASSLKVDGIYGISTYKAIIQFQKRFYNRPDGLVTPDQKTFEKLNAIEHSSTLPKSQNNKKYNVSNSFEKAVGMVAPVTTLPWQIAKNRGSIMEQFQQLLYPEVITIEMLDVVNPRGKGKIGINAKALPYLNQYASHFKMTNKREIAHFLSQIAAESLLKPQAESEGVTKWSVSGIINAYGRKKFKGLNIEDYRETKKLLNYIYANRKDLCNGDEESGDGYLFRGRGFIQITGRCHYRELQEWHKIEFPNDHQDFYKNPDLVADKSHYQNAVMSAFIYWYRIAPQASKVALRDDSTVSDVTRIVNGGCNGYPERLAGFHRLAKYLGLSIPDESKSKRKVCK